MPLADTHSRFLRTATCSDMLDIEGIIPEWGAKSFVQRYRTILGKDLIMECDEVRIFVGRRTDHPEAIRALSIPPDIRCLCE